MEKPNERIGEENHILEVDKTLLGERVAYLIEKYLSPLATWSYMHNCGCDKRRAWLNDRHMDIRDIVDGFIEKKDILIVKLKKRWRKS